MMFLRSIALVGFLLISGCATSADQITIHGANGTEKALITVEVARGESEHQKGLMGRTDVPYGTGMLFVFDPPQQVSMWMKNTLTPLDMIFADRNGRITHIEEGVQPHDLTPRGPESPDTAYVLELKAGSVARYKIVPTDSLAIPRNTR